MLPSDRSWVRVGEVVGDGEDQRAYVGEIASVRRDDPIEQLDRRAAKRLLPIAVDRDGAADAPTYLGLSSHLSSIIEENKKGVEFGLHAFAMTGRVTTKP